MQHNTSFTIVPSTNIIEAFPGDIHPISQEYPGVRLAASISEEELEQFVIGVSPYLGESRQVEEYLSRRNRDGSEVRNTLEVNGVVLHWVELPRDRTNPDLGTSPTIRTVFSVIEIATGEQFFLGFTSVAATAFVKRSILPLRGIGDWSRPLYMEVTSRPLQKGRTYNFKLVSYSFAAQMEVAA